MIRKKKQEYCVSEAVARKCSVKMVFLEISQNSQENTFTYRTPPVAASSVSSNKLPERFFEISKLILEGGDARSWEKLIGKTMIKKDSHPNLFYN